MSDISFILSFSVVHCVIVLFVLLRVTSFDYPFDIFKHCLGNIDLTAVIRCITLFHFRFLIIHLFCLSGGIVTLLWALIKKKIISEQAMYLFLMWPIIT
jgi:hypothetical protein